MLVAVGRAMVELLLVLLCLLSGEDWWTAHEASTGTVRLATRHRSRGRVVKMLLRHSVVGFLVFVVISRLRLRSLGVLLPLKLKLSWILIHDILHGLICH